MLEAEDPSSSAEAFALYRIAHALRPDMKDAAPWPTHW
jgi:hypothetical protein